MFRRTYYVQRAERRNDGEQVTRDTSFTSFMCILFIFIVFTCLIVIVSNWRLLFLVEDEIETFNYNQNKDEDALGKIIVDGKSKESVDWSSTDGDDTTAITTGTTRESTETIEEKGIVALGEDDMGEITLELEGTATTETSKETELIKTTENYISTEMDISNFQTTKAVDELNTSETTDDMTDTTLHIDITKYEAETQQTETTESSQSTETDSTSIQHNLPTFQTTNQWYFQPKKRPSTRITENTESTPTDTTYIIETTDVKRDTTISTSDLIDLDMTQTSNYPYTYTDLFTIAYFGNTPEMLDETETTTESQRETMVTTEMTQESNTETTGTSTLYSGSIEAVDSDDVFPEYDLNQDETFEFSSAEPTGGTETHLSKFAWTNSTPHELINSTERPEQFHNEQSKYRKHGNRYADGKDSNHRLDVRTNSDDVRSSEGFEETEITATTEVTTIIYNTERTTETTWDTNVIDITL